MTGKQRRPHRSNSTLEIVRGIRTLKTIYWTESRLLKLLRRIVRNDREEWFAARMQALKAWPERSRDEIMESASRINPRRGMDGKWWWPKQELEIQRDLLHSAPENSIDVDELRRALAGLDDRQGDRLIELLADSELLKDTTAPLDNGLPQPREYDGPSKPKEFKTRRVPLRRLKRWHNNLMRAIAGDPDGDIAAARGLGIPRANPQSPSGWHVNEGQAGFQVSRKAPGE